MLPKPRILFVFFILFNISASLGSILLIPDNGVMIEISDHVDGLALTATRGYDKTYFGIIGRSLGPVNTVTSTRNMAILNFAMKESQLKINTKTTSDQVIISLKWNGPKNRRFEDCIKLTPHQWYGGPEQKHQYWPVQKLKLEEYSYVTKEYENNAITEPYWINSEGTFFYVDKNVPLFIDQNNKLEDHMCFISEVKPPYSESRDRSELHYDIVMNNNAKEGHMYAVKNYLGKPSGYPDFRMIQHPIWSTWARYSRPIDQNIVMNFAKEIIANDFKNSQIEIDDFWETCYGSFTVDIKKFPDFKKMVQELKDIGFRVTLWIHPFINEDCDPWFTEAKDNKYLVVTEDGGIFTSWWNDNGKNASYVDFTNPDAKAWWINRLNDLQKEYGLDSFKFDAGESSWSPQIPVQKGDIYEHPGRITIDYIRAVAEFGDMIEVRSGQRTQDLPVFVRMLDKDTLWTFDNGLPTLITTLLQMNMNGYPLVLPDLIGGNGYNEKPSKELFIRWLQANTFMPSMQFSFAPWEYDNETISISQKFAKLHADYADVIEKCMKDAVEKGVPVNPPIWWADPSDKEALQIWDEFMLGENILIAPIVEENSTSRDIYIPKGLWAYGEDERYILKGPSWFRKFSVPLGSLAYFLKMP